MQRPTDDQILEYTGRFVEVMREDFERSFGLREFRIYAGAEFDFDARDMDDDLELAVIRRFDAHYDLVRATFDMRWEFLDSHIEARLRRESGTT